jgi:hypothetical protein
MNEYRMMLLWWEATVRTFMGDRVRNELGEVPEKVIIAALFAAGAIAIGGIIITKFTDKANTIPTGP